MPLLVETEHPTGLVEPKLIGKTANGTQKLDSLDGYVTRNQHASEPTEINGTARHNLDEDDQAVLALRNLIFDICNHNGGGHGGSALGMAAIGVALYKRIMRYNPNDPSWFDRDRFVLSNGKTSSFVDRNATDYL